MGFGEKRVAMEKNVTPQSGIDLLNVHVERTGGQHRPQQVAMVEAVNWTLDDGPGSVLCVQAGTGTGKSLAYLYPTLARVRNPNSPRLRVVIATATKQLSEQLFLSDVPVAVDTTGKPISYALLKGRANYVCLSSLDDLQRLDDQAQSQGQLFDEDAGKRNKKADVMKRLSGWAFNTTDGDRTNAPECTDSEWANVSTSDCPGASQCPFGDRCFTEKARTEARKADVVITNHALLAQDFRNQLFSTSPHDTKSVFGEYDVLIIDEAHDFVDTLSSTLSHVFNLDKTEKYVTKLRTYAPEQVDVAVSTLNDVRTVWEAFPKNTMFTEPPGTETVLFAVTALRTLISAVERETKTSRSMSVAKTLKGLEAAVDVLGNFSGNLLDKTVGWFEGGENEKTVPGGKQKTFPLQGTIAPLTPGAYFPTATFDKITVLTSATLALGDDFMPFLTSLGLAAEEKDLKEWRYEPLPDGSFAEGHSYLAEVNPEVTSRVNVLNVGSPFDYPKQGMLYIPTPRESPIPAGATRAAHKEFTLDTTLNLATAAGGRTLALFTTTRMAEDAAVFLRNHLPKSISVYAQGDAPTAVLVKQFADDETSVLCATMGLWQGVDVPGPSCTVVVVDKIGFAPPTDVLTAARVEEAGSSGFRNIVLAQAGRSLTQAAGRLIRSPHDKGVVAILDPRLHTQWYGPDLIASLPPFNVFTDQGQVVKALERLVSTYPEPAGKPVPLKPSRPRKKTSSHPVRRRRR